MNTRETPQLESETEVRKGDIPRLLSSGMIWLYLALATAHSVYSIFFPHAPTMRSHRMWQPGILDSLVSGAVGLWLGGVLVSWLAPRWNAFFLRMRGKPLSDWLALGLERGGVWRANVVGWCPVLMCSGSVWVIAKLTGRAFPPFPEALFAGTVGTTLVGLRLLYGYVRWYDSLPE